MRVLITGAKGFVGKHLVTVLENIMLGKDQTHNQIVIDEIFCYDKESDKSLLDQYCKMADFVFHLAGVNRPQYSSEFMQGNYEEVVHLIQCLKNHHKKCPVMFASSIQATLTGRFENSEYGKSKKKSEDLLFKYSSKNGSRVLVYRFPNLFGKWCRPNYNSVIATFCDNIAHGKEISIDDPETQLELLYIDDLIREMLDALMGNEHRCEYRSTERIEDKNGKYCFAPGAYYKKLGDIANLINSFYEQPFVMMKALNNSDSFEKKLLATYLSYLPEEKMVVPVISHSDDRGSFTELIKTAGYGQISVNISKPGIVKGNHWHHTKWEVFVVVSGQALIQERKIGTDEDGNNFPVHEFKVTGENLEAVYMLPGYTHNIINLSKTDNLVTIIWSNEIFDPNCPDTYREEVEC